MISLKIAVISDIHGNLEALTKVLTDIGSSGVDNIVCLGDCIGYGPDSEEVICEIRRQKIPTIMGNHELAVCNPEQLTWFNPLAQASLRKTMTTLSAASVDFIEQLPKRLVLAQCLCVHGYPPDSVRTYLFQKPAEELVKTFKSMPESICFVGHTHDLEIVTFDGRRTERQSLKQGSLNLDPKCKYIVNVGSVGQPRDGNNNAKYVIYNSEAETLEVRFIPYDIAATVAKIRAAGLPENHASRLW